MVAKFVSSVPVRSVQASLSKSQPFNPEEIIQFFLTAGQYSEFESYSASLAEKVPVNPTVEATMQQLLLDVGLKFGQKMPKSKLRFGGRIKKPLLTWKQQGDIVYFLLHPLFCE